MWNANGEEEYKYTDVPKKIYENYEKLCTLANGNVIIKKNAMKCIE